MAKIAYYLRKGADKISKVNRGKWRTLSTGEKVIKMILLAIKVALICYCGIVVVGIALGIYVACGIMSGITGAIDGQIERSYNYRNRGRYY